MAKKCQCYNHTPQSLARGIMGTRCQRQAKWIMGLSSGTLACDKHKVEILQNNPTGIQYLRSLYIGGKPNVSKDNQSR